MKSVKIHDIQVCWTQHWYFLVSNANRSQAQNKPYLALVPELIRLRKMQQLTGGGGFAGDFA